MNGMLTCNCSRAMQRMRCLDSDLSFRGRGHVVDVLAADVVVVACADIQTLPVITYSTYTIMECYKCTDTKVFTMPLYSLIYTIELLCS